MEEVARSGERAPNRVLSFFGVPTTPAIPHMRCRMTQAVTWPVHLGTAHRPDWGRGSSRVIEGCTWLVQGDATDSRTSSVGQGSSREMRVAEPVFQNGLEDGGVQNEKTRGSSWGV